MNVIHEEHPEELHVNVVSEDTWYTPEGGPPTFQVVKVAGMVAGHRRAIFLDTCAPRSLLDSMLAKELISAGVCEPIHDALGEVSASPIKLRAANSSK
jgi:hypothetical protein